MRSLNTVPKEGLDSRRSSVLSVCGLNFLHAAEKGGGEKRREPMTEARREDIEERGLCLKGGVGLSFLPCSLQTVPLSPNPYAYLYDGVCEV